MRDPTPKRVIWSGNHESHPGEKYGLWLTNPDQSWWIPPKIWVGDEEGIGKSQLGLELKKVDLDLWGHYLKVVPTTTTLTILWPVGFATGKKEYVCKCPAKMCYGEKRPWLWILNMWLITGRTFLQWNGSYGYTYYTKYNDAVFTTACWLWHYFLWPVFCFFILKYMNCAWVIPQLTTKYSVHLYDSCAAKNQWVEKEKQ